MTLGLNKKEDVMESLAAKKLDRLVAVLFEFLFLTIFVLIALTHCLVWELTKSGSYWQKVTDWLALQYKKTCARVGDTLALLLMTFCMFLSILESEYKKPSR